FIARFFAIVSSQFMAFLPSSKESMFLSMRIYVSCIISSASPRSFRTERAIKYTPFEVSVYNWSKADMSPSFIRIMYLFIFLSITHLCQPKHYITYQNIYIQKRRFVGDFVTKKHHDLTFFR